MSLTEEDQKLIDEEEQLYYETIETLAEQLPDVRSKKFFPILLRVN